MAIMIHVVSYDANKSRAEEYIRINMDHHPCCHIAYELQLKGWLPEEAYHSCYSSPVEWVEIVRDQLTSEPGDSS